MNRTAISALCVAACLISVARAKRMRRVVGAFALEQIEHAFDVVERRMRGAA
jgi:hypothetical protein